jgi:hypothetical protein
MSGYTMTQNELLYAHYGAGTASTPTTTPGSSAMVGYPPMYVPAGFMSVVGERSSSLLLKAGGIMIATATVPTWQIGIYGTITQPAQFSGAGAPGLIGQTATFTPSVTTGCWFNLSVRIGLRTLGAYGTGAGVSTVVCIGEFDYVAAAGTDVVQYIPTSPATSYTPSCTVWPTDQQVYIWPVISLGAATAGNTLAMQYMKLYGEN